MNGLGAPQPDVVDDPAGARESTTVGFIGLGRMGCGMAANLLRAGVRLIVFDANPDATRGLTDEGAEGAQSVGALARDCAVVFTSLPGPAEVEEVILGVDGVLDNIQSGCTVFELSTSSVSLARRIHSAFAQRGASMLDAPISGGPAGAASGELAVWVGGDEEVYQRHLGLLRAFAKDPRYVGPSGAGIVTKLAHNATGYMVMLSMAETFSMAVKAGVDPLELWQAMRLGAVGKGSPLDLLTNQFLPGTYEPAAFALRLAHKDVRLATELAQELGVPMRVANLTLQEMTEALTAGFGEQDSRAFLKLQLQRSGVEIAVEPALLQRAINATD